jgi:hypothetical protein
MTDAQRELMRVAGNAGLPVLGRTHPDLPGFDGIVIAGTNSPTKMRAIERKLERVEGEGVRVCPSGDNFILEQPKP